jgi:hypothetical protein
MSNISTVRFTFLILLATVLLTSCNITQRRYMPGYSVDWRSKAPKTIAKKESAEKRNLSVHNATEPVIAKESGGISPASTEDENLKPIKPLRLSKDNNFTSYHISSYTKETTAIPNAAPGDTNRALFFTGEEQLNEQARRSLLYGGLAWGFTALGYLTLVVIVFSTGGALGNPITYAIILFLVGCAVGLFFAVFAAIRGFQGFHEVNAQPDLYYGKTNAVFGIILAFLLSAAMISYFAVKDLK